MKIHSIAIYTIALIILPISVVASVVDDVTSKQLNGVVTDLSLIGSLTGGKIESTHIMIVDPFSSLIATGIAEVFG